MRFKEYYNEDSIKHVTGIGLSQITIGGTVAALAKGLSNAGTISNKAGNIVIALAATDIACGIVNLAKAGYCTLHNYKEEHITENDKD